MFPDPTLQGFGRGDRVPVALFYLDEYIDPHAPSWRLMFEGEIVGWGYTSTALGRSLDFSCVGDIAILTQLFLFYMTGVDSVASTLNAVTQDASIFTKAVPGSIEQFSLFRQGLITTEKDATAFIKRPYDLAYNIVRALTSDKVKRPLPAVNFFTRWTKKQRFESKWVALPYLEQVHENGKLVANQPDGVFPILRAVQSLKAVEAVEQQLARSLEGGSLYRMLKSILDTVFMELAMLPTAAIVSAKPDGTIVGKPTRISNEGFDTPKNQVQLKLAKAHLVVIESYVNTATKRTALAATLVTGGSGVGNLLSADISAALDDSLPSSQRTALAFVSGRVTSATIPKKAAELLEMFKTAQTTLKYTITNLETAVKDAETSLITRLTNYFIKPQMLFGLPPVCNVLFPSMISDIMYQESYATQPTRLYFEDATLAGLMQTNTATRDYLMTVLARAYPPEADWAMQEKLKNNAADTGKNLLLWPDEFFQGPITARYPAPPWLMYYAKQMQGEKGATGVSAEAKRLTDETVYTLYAQYEFYRQRYGERNGTINAAFNPYLVPGFPLVAFDSMQSAHHLMGYLMNVNQTFQGNSVSTSLNYSYGRTLTEFLEDVAKEMDKPVDASRAGLATAAAPPEPLKEVRDVTQHFTMANQLYRDLFYQKDTSRKKASAFDYRQVVGFQETDGSVTSISIEGQNEETKKARLDVLNEHLRVVDTYLGDATRRVEIINQLVMGRPTTAEFTQLLAAVDAVVVPYEQRAVLTPFVAPDNAAGWASRVAAVPERVKKLNTLLKLVQRNLKLKATTIEADNAVHNLTGVKSKVLAPKPGTEGYFDSYDEAMKYCSRPICTLEEYIDFIGNGVRDTPIDDLAYTDGTQTGARYYARIRKFTGFREGIDKPPTTAQRGVVIKQATQQTTDALAKGNTAAAAVTMTASIEVASQFKAVAEDFPDMRKEWDQLIMAHRTRVYTQKVSR